MGAKIGTDELVKKLLIDGKKPEDTIVFYAFVGYEKDNIVTVYFDMLLQNSAEIKVEDILYSVDISKTHSALGGTMIWLKNASSYMNIANQNQAQSEVEAQQFFKGNIYEQYATTMQAQAQQNYTQQCKETQPPICHCCK